MSLINKMLHDLEKRNAFIKDKHDPVLEGLYSAYDIELSEKKKSSKLIVLLFCLVSFNIYFFNNK